MAETVPAVVLAGGRKPEEVARALGLPHKALTPVAGKPAVRWVVEALQKAELVGPVVVATEQEEIARAVPEGVAVAKPTGGSMLDTVLAGFAAFPQAERVVLCTSDLPLLTPAAVDDFTRRALDSRAEFCYSIVRGDRLQPNSTGEKRTLIPLRDGPCSGGNIFCISRRFLQEGGPWVNAAFAGRKSPLKLASLLGFSLIWGLLWKRLSLPQIVDKAQGKLGMPLMVVDSEYPEVCFDIDKLAHVAVAEAALGGSDQR